MSETKPKVNKMHVAIGIMRRLIADNPKKTPAEVNRMFKDEVKAKLAMTVNGANTYCTNVRTFLAGKDPYATNKAANRKRKELADASQQDPVLKEIATNIGLLKHEPHVDVNQRWWVVDEKDSKVMETHATRSTAQKIAQVFGVSWKDRTKLIEA